MKSAFRTVAVVMFVLVAASLLLAADVDVKGSKDYPLVSRMPDYFIVEYKDIQFDQVIYKIGNPAKLTDTPVEGHVYKIRYIPARTMTTKPSPLQVIRNVQAALKQVGGEVLFENSWNANTWRGTVVRVTNNNNVIWVGVRASPSDYTLEIVEQQAMKQDIVADATSYANDLQRTGKATLSGIYFDTAKSILKAESEAAIAEIAKLLQQQPKLKVYIVGHTDSVGDSTSNLKLSQDRAKAVVTALTTKHGIASTRLLSFGNGPYAPVASNRTEEGRAKNRRVEMVEAGE